MAQTKQITATINTSLVDWIEKQPERGMGLSFSKTVEKLLVDIKAYRETGKVPKKDWRTKYTK